LILVSVSPKHPGKSVEKAVLAECLLSENRNAVLQSLLDSENKN
jgi:hypothetical protein